MDSTSYSLQDAYLLDRAIDPASAEFGDLMDKLLRPVDDGRPRGQRLASEGQWRYTLPYKGDPQVEGIVLDKTPLRVPDKGPYRNGLASLALAASDIVELIAQSSGKHRLTPTVVFSTEKDNLASIMFSAGSMAPTVFYDDGSKIADALAQHRPETIIVDHTTLAIPVDKLLSLAYAAGVTVVDGVFPYHVAASKGWDVVAGVGHWSFTHSGSSLVVGPDDDCSRLLKYRSSDYLKFVEPHRWRGNAKRYGYEIRKSHEGLLTYRAVYLGDQPVRAVAPERLSYKLETCSSEDMVLVTVNKELAAGVYASSSNNAQMLASLRKDYAVEVRRDLFVSCVEYLIARDRGADIVGDSIRYINMHNYVDLVDGVRIVRCASLRYADALCVAMVCALTAFSLRYRLTNESIPDVVRTVAAAKLSIRAPFGALGRLAWLFGTYVSDALGNLAARSRDKALAMLYSADKIPGLCYDVYMDKYYVPDAPWDEGLGWELKDHADAADAGGDPFTAFLGEKVATYTPTVLREKAESRWSAGEEPYIPAPVPDPEVALQEVYDHAFPGNSVAGVQGAAEMRRVRDVNVNTEFYGRIEVNKDVAAPERLPVQMPVRTTALAASRTPLLDAILASAKRNFNPPDLQIQSDPWAYAGYLADKFIEFAFVPNFRETIGRSYRDNPVTFNMTDYLEWRSTRTGAYRSALLAECPEELVELGLEKFDTIVKQRVKPKLSTAAQHELAQPQVIVSMSKKDTALFTSLFRVIFERFDNALRKEICSAGRLSDDEISEWLTGNLARVTGLRAIELDSGKYDKSQGLLARMIEAVVLEALGLDPKVLEIYADSYAGRVSSRSLGLVFMSVYQMKSGAPDTMLGNIIYNAVSAVESVGPRSIEAMILKGDDNVTWLKADVDGQMAVGKMSSLFNLESKLIVGQVIYFSSGYVVPCDGRAYFCPDPLKMLELLGEGGGDPRTQDERFRSFGDRVRSLTRNVAIPQVLQSLVRVRLGVPDLNVVLLVDALAAVAASPAAYARVKPVGR